MYRQIIIPKDKKLVLNLPDEFVGKEVKVTAEPINRRRKTKKRKYSLEENRQFYSKYRFGTLRIKFTREELYDR